jgi:hypothetical protein
MEKAPYLKAWSANISDSSCLDTFPLVNEIIGLILLVLACLCLGKYRKTLSLERSDGGFSRPKGG